MIHLNRGLTDEKRAKVTKPYSANCRDGVFDFKAAGEGVASFVRDNTDLLRQTGEQLDTSKEKE